MFVCFALWLACHDTTPKEDPEIKTITQTSPPKPDSFTSPKELHIFELNDGTTITGELEGTSADGFVVKSKSLGTMTIPSTELLKMTPFAEKTSSKPQTVQNPIEYTISPSKLQEYTPTRNTSSIPIPSTPQKTIPISALQDAMMQDPEILGLLHKLQNDPEIMRIVQDPEILILLQKGDLQALANHPALKKLESNSEIQNIIQSMKP